MSSAVSSTNVPSTPILVTPSTDSTKTSTQQSPFDFNNSKRDESSEDQRHLNKQSSANKIYTRGNSNKNKQLTRSHAMKETASPPRTPNSHSPSEMKSHSPTAPALVTQTPDDSASSSQLLTAPPTFILPLSEQAASGSGKSQLDIDFPKLTPPKTKWNSSSPPGSNTNTATRNHNRKSVSSDTSSNNNSICEDGNESHINENCTSNNNNNKASQQKTGSQISNSSTNNNNDGNNKKQQQGSESDNDHNSSVMSVECKLLDERECMSPTHTPCKSPSNPSNNNYNTQNDNNNNSGSKSSSSGSFITVKGKPPLKNMGSSSSCEGGNTSSGFISRDSSSEQFVDQNGIDLVQFFKETLNKNAKDRNMLLKIERDLISLAVDQTGRTFTKFPPMSSYNRMLVHRTAAYFGMDHNVDSTQQCVIASVSKDTRIPEIRFKTLIRDTFSEEPRKSILRREAHSFEDYRQGGLLAVHRGILNRKAKSFEEREEEYDKDWQWIQQEREEHGGEFHNKLKVPSRLMKGHSTEGRYHGGERNPSVSKSHSFGSYGPNSLTREDSITSNKSGNGKLHKQDSLNTTWRFSPSSCSGFKSQSMRSDSFTPSPTGYGSDTPEASSSPDRGVVWAVTDIASVPKGSLIIDPQTLQPILNQDGSLYHFDPSNPPTKTGRYGSGGSRKNKPDRKSLTNNSSGKSTTNNKETPNNTNNSSNEKLTNNKVLTHPKVNIVNDENDDDIDDDDDDQTDLHLDTSSKSHQQQTAQDTKDNEDFDNKSSQCETSQYLNTEEMSPKRKSQATSPNLPLNDLTINEEEESISPTIIEDSRNEDDVKKDEIISTSATATPPVQEIRYTSQYVNTANSTVTPVMSYAPPAAFTAPIEQGGAIYHTGPDGTLYVLSQPVMYSYAPSTENEVTNCWVPIFDQGALQTRDPNIPTAVMTYQPAPAAAAAPTTLYTTQSPVVYSTEQFANQSPQVAQYPVSYPTMGYTYPVNGAPYQNFWPQPMTTYILPQPTATPQPGQVIINQPGAPQTPNTATLIQSTAHNTLHNPSTNSSNTTGRRNTPPSNHHNSNNGNRDNNHIVSSSTTIQATAVPLQTFPTSAPLPTEAGQVPGPQTIYALPPSMYQNVLPYQTAPATASFYQPLPHPPANTTIISSVIPHTNPPPPPPPQSGTLPSTPHSYQSNAGTHITSSGEVVTHFPFTHTSSNNQQSTNNAASTPQSTPSTPITIQQNFKNPPLFATPPIIASVSTTPSLHMEKNNSSGSGVYLPKKYNGNNGVMNTPPPTKSNTRYSIGGGYQQNNNNNNNNSTLGNAQGGKKNMNYNPSNPNNNSNANNNSNNSNNNNSSNSSSEDTSSLTLNSNSTNNNYRAKNRDQSSAGSNNYQPKTSSYIPKGQQQQQQHSNYSNSQSPNSNENVNESTGKYVHRGPSRAVPPSLDLKRNNSNTNVMTNNYHHHNRSTPSTNSTESNNSPNSITSYDHSRNFHYSHNPAPTHFITQRGGSAGPSDPPMPTYFPFNVQNPGASAQLIDPCQNQALIGYNNTGMYVKLGPAVTFASPNPNSRKSPSNDMRMVSGIYTMPMLPGPTGPRHMNPRAVQNNHNNNFKGNRTQR